MSDQSTPTVKDFTDALGRRLQSFAIKYKDKPLFAAYKAAAFSVRAVFVFGLQLARGKAPKAKKIEKPPLSLTPHSGFVAVERGGDAQNIFTIAPPASGHQTYDVPAFLATHPEVTTIDFVFFMGLGDYVVGCNFFQLFRDAFPNLKMRAWVSNHADGNNSPLVADLLRENALFERVEFFEGRPAKFWKLYDYSDALQKAADGTLVLPVLYQHDAEAKSRVRSLCETFGIETPSLILPPNLPLKASSETVASYVETLKSRLRGQKLIYLQLVGRSSRYEYPYAKDLIHDLVALGFFIITADALNVDHPQVITLDTKQFSITDSIKILKGLHQITSEFYGITISSVGSAITSVLGIPSIIMQQKCDEAIHSVYFSNQWIVSNYRYHGIPDDRLVLVDQPPRKTEFEKIEYFDFDKDHIVELIRNLERHKPLN